MKNLVQLITYGNRLSHDLPQLNTLLQDTFAGCFGGLHILPFFTPIDGADAGFDPIDHAEVDPRLGDWDEVRTIGSDLEIVADLIVNHVSSASSQFKSFLQEGSESPFAGLFLTYGRVFPNGATEEELLKIYRPRPGLPFTGATIANGERRLLWTTFTPQQIDIDVRSPEGRTYLSSILSRFRSAGVRMIRLDAVGYAIKKPGTSCFMIPETFEFIATLTEESHALGIEVLVEIHSHYLHQLEIAQQVDWIYDFALPPLVLHSLFSGDAKALCRWLKIRPSNCVTVLDTHDGIGVIDVGAGLQGEPGLLDPIAIDRLVETIHERSDGQSRKATGAAANNLDLYQVNCTYYDALGQRDNEYLIARAIQFFVPGIPQVYYVGLLAGVNDMELLTRSGVGRDINRHYYTEEEIHSNLERPVVRTLIELIKFRNQHPAFSGEFRLHDYSEGILTMEWQRGSEFARLQVDVGKRLGAIAYSTESGQRMLSLAASKSTAY